MLPHPVRVKHLTYKVGNLRVALNDDAIRTEAAAVLATLIESVTIYPEGWNGPEVVAKVEDLIGFARNEDTRLAPCRGQCSMTLVAGQNLAFVELGSR